MAHKMKCLGAAAERGDFAKKKREAAAGIEPALKGSADPRLTTWLRRLILGVAD